MITLGIVGNVVTVTATFMQTINGVANTPTPPEGTITFVLRTADSPTLLLEQYPSPGIIQQVSSTVYKRTYVCTIAGEYIVEVAAATGAGQAAEDAIWHIAPSALYT
jgi:hypothetical protein